MGNTYPNSFFHEGGRVPSSRYGNGVVHAKPCPPLPCPPPPELLPPEIRALVEHLQSLVLGDLAPVIQRAINSVICQSSPPYVQLPPHQGIPFNAKPTDIFGRLCIIPTGVATATTSATLARAGEMYGLGASALSQQTVAVNTLVTLGSQTIPDGMRAIYNRLEFRGHDWASTGPLSQLQITRNNDVVVDLQEFPETPKDMYVTAQAGQTVSLKVMNKDANSFSIVEARLTGFLYPVSTKENTLEGTLVRTGLTTPCGGDSQP